MSSNVTVIRKRKIDVAESQNQSESGSTCLPPNADTIRSEIKEIIFQILRKILSQPKALSIDIVIGSNTTIYMIDVVQEDFGRLLGSKGKTIGGLRTVIGAMAAASGIRAVISVKDEERFF
jgi:predicted RNA-binding protein YlqC (UPF0109 family)